MVTIAPALEEAMEKAEINPIEFQPQELKEKEQMENVDHELIEEVVDELEEEISDELDTSSESSENQQANTEDIEEVYKTMEEICKFKGRPYHCINRAYFEVVLRDGLAEGMTVTDIINRLSFLANKIGNKLFKFRNTSLIYHYIINNDIFPEAFLFVNTMPFIDVTYDELKTMNDVFQKNRTKIFTPKDIWKAIGRSTEEYRFKKFLVNKDKNIVIKNYLAVLNKYEIDYILKNADHNVDPFYAANKFILMRYLFTMYPDTMFEKSKLRWILRNWNNLEMDSPIIENDKVIFPPLRHMLDQVNYVKTDRLTPKQVQLSIFKKQHNRGK